MPTSLDPQSKMFARLPVGPPDMTGSRCSGSSLDRPSANFGLEFASTPQPPTADFRGAVPALMGRVFMVPATCIRTFARSQQVFSPAFTSPGAMHHSAHLTDDFLRHLISRFSLCRASTPFGCVLCDSTPPFRVKSNPSPLSQIHPADAVPTLARGEHAGRGRVSPLAPARLGEYFTLQKCVYLTLWTKTPSE